MVIITIFTMILSYSLPFLKNSINTILFRRICAISFLYASVINFNTLCIQSIGTGVGLYSGFFEVGIINSLVSFFMLLISSIILFIWPNLNEINQFMSYTYNFLPSGLVNKKNFNNIIN